MSRMIRLEHKPLSFSTTMRNPMRIGDFLNCIAPFEGQILTNNIIDHIIKNVLQAKLYHTMYQRMNKELWIKFVNEETYSNNELNTIIENSPQQHKEAGFDKGWPSRFDTWYKLPMELGFVFYKINEPIIISTAGHLLLRATNQETRDESQIQNIFLNSLMKYQTNNPFRRNLNENAPLVLLLEVLKILSKTVINSSGIHRNELPLLICWPNNNAQELCNLILSLRKKYQYAISDEVIYEECLKLLGADHTKKKRFKINQLTNEAVDDFIRKMRITGLFSLRGGGRFIDLNHFEQSKATHILEHYKDMKIFQNEQDYFNYMGQVDSIVLFSEEQSNDAVDVKLATLKNWTKQYSKEEIYEELHIINKRGESKNNILRFIDKPTRFEFLISICLCQHFPNLKVLPNYSVDDEGLPKYVAAGGKADIECSDINSDSIVEVTLMTSRNQSIVEIPAITRHLQELAETSSKQVFSIFIAPTIHADTIYMVGYTKYQYKLDILAYNIEEFLTKIQQHIKINDFLNSDL